MARAYVQPLAVVRAGYSTRDFTEGNVGRRFFVVRVCPPLSSLWISLMSA